MSEQVAKLRALVVDDEWAARNYLVELLEGSRRAEVAGAVGSAAEAREIVLGEAGRNLDALFLDIRLSGHRQDGLELARELAAMPQPPMLVLATALSAHAIEAYELGAADYLLKPFTEQRVERCLERLLARRPKLQPDRPLRVAARKQKSLVFFDRDEVWAFEAAERLTRVHTARGIFDVDLSLAAIETSIGRTFVRVHRSWLVNLEHIKELERDSETRLWVGEGSKSAQRGIHVPVARERAQPLRDLLLANATGVRRSNE